MVAFNLNQKIWSGFSVILLVLVVVSLTTMNALNDSEITLKKVVHEFQPRTLASLELSAYLKSAESALGFYLLSKEVIYRTQFEESLIKISISLEALKKIEASNAEEKYRQLLVTIGDKIGNFITFKERMLFLSNNQLENFPAIKYAGEHINPISREILQALSNMISAEEEEEISAERRSFTLNIEAARYTWASLMGEVRTYMILGDKSSLENVNLYLTQFNKYLSKIENNSDMLGFIQEEYFDIVMEKSKDFPATLDGFKVIFSSNRSRTDAFLMRTEVGPILSAIRIDLNTLIKLEKDNIQAVSNSLLDSLSSSKVLTIGLLLSGLIIGGALSWVIASVIVMPMRKAVKAMNDIAAGEGDLTKRLNINSKDEIGELGAEFNAFAEKIKSLISSSFAIIDKINTKVSQLFIVAQTARERSEDQQHQTKMVADNVQEVANHVESVTKNALLATKAANTANEATNNGKKVVQNTIQNIESMAAGVESAAEAMSSLTDQTNKIGMVVDVIKGIAEQTNLLALNAAIEAARAGEQGRGFAVVADEVRSLASKTQSSTDEIETMINSLQKDANAATQIMQAEKERAGGSVDQAIKTGEAFELIYKSVSSISRMNNEIEQVAKIQQDKTNTVINVIGSLVEIAEKNASGAQETYQSASELQILESDLKLQMSQFKIK